MELDSTEHGTPPGDGLERGPEDPRLFERVKARLFGARAGEEPQPPRIGRFVLLERIGEGGMGLIYAAYDDALDRRVAVKLLRPERVSTGTEGRARLLREAQALARLSHPAVIHVYEVGTWEDEVYIAMEYVQGSTLKQWQNKRSWREVLEAYRQAGAGLQAAHDAGIVHRDFKSDNVLVRSGASPILKQGSVRVLDFGLARTELAGGDAELSNLREQLSTTTDIPLTHTGAVMGTPAYMAPEQHAGSKTDHRTDQFSFCVSLFEGLYGYRPFSADTLIELQSKVLDGNVEPAPRYTEVPPRVHQAILRGLSVEPTERYPSMSALLDDLAEGSTARQWRWAMLGAAVVVVAAGAMVWPAEDDNEGARDEARALEQAIERAGRVDAEAELARLRSRTVAQRWDDLVLSYARSQVDEAPTRALASLKHLNPADDRWVVTARAIAGHALLRGPIDQRLDNLRRVKRLRFSNDGRLVGVLDERGEPAVWDLRGGYRALDPESETIPPVADLALRGGGDAATTVWLAANDGRLWRWHVGEAAPVVDVARTPLVALALAPGGTVAAGDETGAVHLIDTADGTVVRVLTGHEDAVSSLDFSADGDTLVSGSKDGTAIVWFLERKTHRSFDSGAPIDRARFLDDGNVIAAWTEGNTVETWSVDGRAVTGSSEAPAAWDGSHQSRSLWYQGGELLVRDGRFDANEAVHPLDTEGRPLRTVALDPTGRHAVAATDEGLLSWRIGRGRSGGPSAGHILLRGKALVRRLVFVRDGSLLVLDSTGRVKRWQLDGTSQPWLRDRGRIEDIAASPDGGSVAVALPGRELALVEVDGPTAQLGSMHGDGHPTLSWSPDGRWVSATSCGDGPCTIDVLATDGSSQWGMGGRGDFAATRFAPGGNAMFVVHQAGLWVRRLDGTQDEGQASSAAWWGAERRVIAWAFAGEAIRVAVAQGTIPGEAGLEIWWLGPESTSVERVLSMPDLPHLVASSDGAAILMRTDDARTLLWHLDEDEPIALIPSPGNVRWLEVSPDRRTLLVLTPEDERPALLDVASGQTRHLAPHTGPHAWSRDGTIAIGTKDIRLYFDPAPADPVDFIRWLDETTAVTVELEELR